MRCTLLRVVTTLRNAASGVIVVSSTLTAGLLARSANGVALRAPICLVPYFLRSRQRIALQRRACLRTTAVCLPVDVDGEVWQLWHAVLIHSRCCRVDTTQNEDSGPGPERAFMRAYRGLFLSVGAR